MIRWGSVIDFGDVPTWLAFAGAGVAAWCTRQTLELERARDREVAGDRRRAQAVLVSAWIGKVDHTPLGHGIGLIVRNLADQPVYSVFVEASQPQAEFWSPVVALRRAVLPPGATEEWIAHELTSERAEDSFGLLSTVLRFRDSAGRVWQRDADGQLSERPG